MQDLKFLNALNSIPGVGAATLRLLKNHFGTFAAAWQADETALRASGIHAQALQAILWKKPSLHPDKEMERVLRERIWMVTEEDPRYPPLLKEISHAPIVLYGQGSLSAPSDEKKERRIAVVGTRRPTTYGGETVRAIVHKLVEGGLTIISGLATGIDTRAHDAALDSGGKTIAVLGSGVDPSSIFPPENRGLARRIQESGGAVISEYAPGTPAIKEHFPQRNRIISGLSEGVVVVEAREKSGALITARFALDQNREVFAIPGPIFSPTAAGPHRLIQEGAKLVTCAEDIFEELGIEYTKEKEKRYAATLNEKEQQLVILLKEPASIDALKEKTGLATPIILSSLSLLELKGIIRHLGGDIYQKIN